MEQTKAYKFGMWVMNSAVADNDSRPLEGDDFRDLHKKMKADYGDRPGGYLVPACIIRDMDVLTRFWQLMEDVEIKAVFDAGYFAARKRVSARAFKNYCKKRAEREIPETLTIAELLNETA